MKFKIKILTGLMFMLNIICVQAATIGLRIPDTTGVRGDYLTIPVYVDSNLTGNNVTSYQLEIVFNQSRLVLDSVLATGTLTQLLGGYTYNQTSPNSIVIACAGTTPLTGTGILIYLRFRMHANGYSNVSFTDTLHNFFNEGNPSVLLDNGSINVTNPPTIQVSPNTGLLTVNEQLQFSASGGTSPYIWSVTNPLISAIDASGLLTTTGSGFTQIVAEDALGVIDTTNGFIEIRPLKLSLPDTSVYQGQVIDIPVYTTDLSGLNITSGSFKLTYSSNRLSAVNVISSGTLLAGYTNPSFNAGSGQIEIAFAGSAPLTGQGILLYVQMIASTQSSGYTNINFSDVLFNQNILATDDGGSCNVIQLAALNITPNSATLMAGDTLRFSVIGGVAPYTWGTSNPAIATIDNSGLLTAIKGGVITVSVLDNIGATGITNNIEIFDTRVILPDTTANLGYNFELPVFIEELPVGQNILSVQTTIQYDTTALKNPSIITTGTLSNGWSYGLNMVGNEIVLAGAGTNPVNTSGIFFKIRFFISPNVAVGYQANLNFQDILLNEGSPIALTSNGSITTTVAGIPVQPTLVSPLNGATGVSVDPTLCWNFVSGAQTYGLQVSSTSNFSVIEIDQSNIVDTCYTGSGLANNTTYYWRTNATNIVGTSPWSTVWSFQTSVNAVECLDCNQPTQYKLSQNYPNPFNPQTYIEFALPKYSFVTLQVYNSIGEEIATLIQQTMSAGQYRVIWDAKDYPSGSYYYRIQAGKYQQIRKMLLLK